MCDCTLGVTSLWSARGHWSLLVILPHREEATKSIQVCLPGGVKGGPYFPYEMTQSYLWYLMPLDWPSWLRPFTSILYFRRNNIVWSGSWSYNLALKSWDIFPLPPPPFRHTISNTFIVNTDIITLCVCRYYNEAGYRAYRPYRLFLNWMYRYCITITVVF